MTGENRGGQEEMGEEERRGKGGGGRREESRERGRRGEGRGAGSGTRRAGGWDSKVWRKGHEVKEFWRKTLDKYQSKQQRTRVS